MIILRPITSDDLPLLHRWEQQPHVIAAGIEDWDWEGDILQDTLHVENLIAELHGQPIGFMQIIDPALEPGHYWGEVPENLRAIDIFIGEPDYLGKGYGTQMMHLALERSFADPDIKSILIDPLATNTRAHCFYERLGFEFLEYRTFGKDECKVYLLTRNTWQYGKS